MQKIDKYKQICQSLFSTLKMEKSFVKINGIPTGLLTVGENVSDKPKKIILVIPGKMTHFYFEYFDLKKKTYF